MGIADFKAKETVISGLKTGQVKPCL
jgi:hypothetical protein